MNIRNLLGLPDVLQAKKVIAIQPHPDDNEVNIAGTLLELSKRGCEIVYITVTDGRAGGFGVEVNPQSLVKVREQEKIEAGRIIGVAKQIDLGFHDGGSYSVADVTKELVYLFRKERPDLVFSVDPWLPYEAHPDHVKVGMAAAQAMLFSPNAVNFPAEQNSSLYQVPQIAFYATAYPNEFIMVTDHFDRKLQSIFAHRSQFDIEKWEVLKLYFQMEAQRLYKQKHGEHAKGFAESLKVLAVEQLHSVASAMYS